MVTTVVLEHLDVTQSIKKQALKNMLSVLHCSFQLILEVVKELLMQ